MAHNLEEQEADKENLIAQLNSVSLEFEDFRKKQSVRCFPSVALLTPVGPGFLLLPTGR
jgi:hypothetical protein